LNAVLYNSNWVTCSSFHIGDQANFGVRAKDPDKDMVNLYINQYYPANATTPYYSNFQPLPSTSKIEDVFYNSTALPITGPSGGWRIEFQIGDSKDTDSNIFKVYVVVNEKEKERELISKKHMQFWAQQHWCWRWYNTNIYLEPGQTLEISADGVVNCGYSGCDFGPDGWTSCPSAPDTFAAPGLTFYALVGKIGSHGTPFLIGSNYGGKVNRSRYLFLIMNDDKFEDNSGYWNVHIKVYDQ